MTKKTMAKKNDGKKNKKNDGKKKRWQKKTIAKKNDGKERKRWVRLSFIM